MEVFRRRWGDYPGEIEPSEYWDAWLGHWFHLRPNDMQHLTPHQLDGCFEFIEKQRD